MSELRVHKREVLEVDYGDLERFIQDVYGVDEFSFVADVECGNDSYHSFTVGKEEIDEYEMQELEAFMSKGEHGWKTRTILTDLANKDKIPSGEYLVHVSW